MDIHRFALFLSLVLAALVLLADAMGIVSGHPWLFPRFLQ
jgi:hypothetical protein